MDAKLAELRAGADLTRVWLVVDMDAFYASVEELDSPSLVSSSSSSRRASAAYHCWNWNVPACLAAPVATCS